MLKFLKNLFLGKPKEMEGFQVGSIVKVVNNDFVYPNYSQQAAKLPKMDQLHWVYKEFPKDGHVFEIISLMYHVMEDQYDKGDVVIAIRDLYTKQVYLVNEHAIAPVNKSDT